MKPNPDRLFDLVFVRPPSASYPRCVSSNLKKREIDLTLARTQHKNYVSILKESEIEVIELGALEQFPDSVFIQDPAVLGLQCCVIGRFGEQSRRGEEKTLLGNLKDFEMSDTTTITRPGTLEGGDVVLTDRGIFVGESRRTNNKGIQQFATIQKDHKVHSVKTQLLHLLCGCSYLNNGTMIIAPDLVPPEAFPGFRLVTLPLDDAYASDALYLGENKVLIPSGYPNAVRKLKVAGFKPLEVEMSEFWKGDGGVTCLSCPVYKIL